MRIDLDALQQQIDDATSERERVALLNRLSYHAATVDPERSRRAAREALRRATLAGDREGVAESWLNLGIATMRGGRPAAAATHLSRAERLYSKLGNKVGRARAFLNLGSAALYRRDHPLAVELYEQAITLFTELGDEAAVGTVFGNLGIVYEHLGDYPRALEYHAQALDIDERHGVPTCYTRGNIGLILWRQGNVQDARAAFISALEEFRELNDVLGQINALTNLGALESDPHQAIAWTEEALALQRPMENHYQIGRLLLNIASEQVGLGLYDEAAVHLKEAEAIGERTEDRYLLALVAIALGRMAHRQGDHQKAIAVWNEGCEHAESVDDISALSTLHWNLSEACEAMEDFASAYRHNKRYIALQEEILGQERQQELQRLHSRMAVERSERERELLQVRAEQLQEENETKSRELAALAMQLAQKNQILDDVGEQLAEISTTAASTDASSAIAALRRRVGEGRNVEEGWKTFEEQFRAMHHDFIERMAQRAPQLTPTELRVCALLKINLSTKEIAELLVSSARTVEHHRYKIRTKLALPPETNLTVFLAAF